MRSIASNPVQRVFVSRSVSDSSWRSWKEAGPTIVEAEDLTDVGKAVLPLPSVRQLWLRGSSHVPRSFLARFPRLEKLWVRGPVVLVPDGVAVSLPNVLIEDAGPSAREVILQLQVSRLEVSGLAPGLATAITIQRRLRALHLRELRFEISDVDDIVPRLEAISLHRVPQVNYAWLGRARKLRQLSLAYQREFTDLGKLASLPALRVLTLASMKGIEGFDHVGGLRRLELVSLDNLGAISSLAALQRLPRLQILQVLGNCSLADGRVAFLREMQSLRHVLIEPRRHYDADTAVLERMSAREAMPLIEALCDELYSRVKPK